MRDGCAGGPSLEGRAQRQPPPCRHALANSSIASVRPKPKPLDITVTKRADPLSRTIGNITARGPRLLSFDDAQETESSRIRGPHQRVRRRLNTLRARQVGHFQSDVAVFPVLSPGSFAIFAQPDPSVPGPAGTSFIGSTIRFWSGFGIFMQELLDMGRLGSHERDLFSQGPTAACRCV